MPALSCLTPDYRLRDATRLPPNYIYFIETLLGAEDNARTTQVIRRQLHRDLVTGQYADLSLIHI